MCCDLRMKENVRKKGEKKIEQWKLREETLRRRSEK
jgi:hypothetical protein